MSDIQLKRSSVAGKVPDAANVLVGEPVINLTDKIIFTKDGSGNVVVIGAGTTSNVTEGTNLYFTNARVVAALTEGSGINIDSNGLISSNVSSSGSGMAYTESSTAPSNPSEGDKWLDSNTGIEYTYIVDTDSSQWVEFGVTYSPINTSNVLEGTNLYYTDTRVYSNVIQIGYATNSNVSLKANVVDLTSANVTEKTNLYFTNARVVAALTEGSGINIDSNGLISSTVSSGGNWSIKTSDYTAVNGDWLYVDTSTGVITITLPNTPSTGNNVKIASGPTASSNAINISRNGSTIMGLSENMTVSDNNISFELLYTSSTWRIVL